MHAQLKLKHISKETCFIKGTHKASGGTRQVSPENSTTRNFFYRRIRIDAGDGPIAFSTGDHETGLICLSASATIEAAGSKFKLNRYDALYVRGGSRLEASQK